MKLSSLTICGFRGYRERIHLDFGKRFTVIDGRNGVGKSTIFDAIEFAITGSISKYGDAKAAGQTVEDYIWWKGDGSPPEARYVEVVFEDDNSNKFRIHRDQLDGLDRDLLIEFTERLCDMRSAPQSPLLQLCAASIIRDELITNLSLDLKEADRYSALRATLGANDADSWIDRASRVASIAKHRVSAAQNEVASLNTEITSAVRKIDEIRSSLSDEKSILNGTQRLQELTASNATGSDLEALSRFRISQDSDRADGLRSLLERFDYITNKRTELLERQAELASLEENVKKISGLAIMQIFPDSFSAFSDDVSKLVKLHELGKEIGLREGKCPLCASEQSEHHFHHGLTELEALVRRLDEAAVVLAEHEQERKSREEQMSTAQKKIAMAENVALDVLAEIELFDDACEQFGLTRDPRKDALIEEIARSTSALATARRDLRSIEALRLNQELYRNERALTELRDRLARSQERFSKARKVETKSQALHDAARRAAAETLDQRLERVLPLMADLYQRLNPHPVWRDIEYSIRGDIKRFLKLQVGENLNPQFLFSSGQRRATGLAFLLSINLAISWSRWRTIMLDDPVQHIDDFRAIHLAEVMAQLVSSDHQIICAVEDAALADLLCRRLPVGHVAEGRRITLGIGPSGAIAKEIDRPLAPFIQSSLQATG